MVHWINDRCGLSLLESCDQLHQESDCQGLGFRLAPCLWRLYSLHPFNGSAWTFNLSWFKMLFSLMKLMLLYIIVGPIARKRSLKQIHSQHWGCFFGQTFIWWPWWHLLWVWRSWKGFQGMDGTWCVRAPSPSSAIWDECKSKGASSSPLAGDVCRQCLY